MKRSCLLIGVFLSLSLAFLPANVAAEEETRQPAKKKEPTTDPRARKISTDRVATESPLVRAARLARESRSGGKRSTISIDDEDVRTSTGRITTGQYNGPDALEPGQASAGEILSKMEKDRERSAGEAKDAEERVRELELEVARMERAAALIEDDYYEYSDTEDREDALTHAFEQNLKNLTAKREELEAARAHLTQKRREATNVVNP